MERVGIGGYLLLYSMSRGDKGPRSIQMTCIERFDDFEADWNLLLSKLPENADDPLSKLLLATDP
jgi:hypothetical protein